MLLSTYTPPLLYTGISHVAACSLSYKIPTFPCPILICSYKYKTAQEHVNTRDNTQMQQLTECTQLLYTTTADNKSSLVSLQAAIIISRRFPACSYENQLCDIWRCFLPQPHLTVGADDITQLTATRFPKGPPLQ